MSWIYYRMDGKTEPSNFLNPPRKTGGKGRITNTLRNYTNPNYDYLGGMSLPPEWAVYHNLRHSHPAEAEAYKQSLLNNGSGIFSDAIGKVWEMAKDQAVDYAGRKFREGASKVRENVAYHSMSGSGVSGVDLPLQPNMRWNSTRTRGFFYN